MTFRDRWNIVVALLFAAASAAAIGQDYPARPVRLIVPLPAGGWYDSISRTVGPQLAKRMGQPFLVENRVGAGGLTGTGYVAGAPADGYTLLVNGTGPMAIYATIYAKMPYDTLRDFAPIALLSTVPQLLVAQPSLGARTVSELMQMARARPGELAFASTGTASQSHLTMEVFAIGAGMKLLHVPYNGSAPAVVSVLGGQTVLCFTVASDLIAHVRAGKLRALAVGSQKRMKMLPDVPTVAESTVPGFESEGWGGLFAPAQTSRDIVRRLNAEVNRVLEMPEVSEPLAFGGVAESRIGTPEQFDQFVRAEVAKWTRIVKTVKDSGVKVE